MPRPQRLVSDLATGREYLEDLTDEDLADLDRNAAEAAVERAKLDAREEARRELKRLAKTDPRFRAIALALGLDDA